jgi:hypothetical protein
VRRNASYFKEPIPSNDDQKSQQQEAQQKNSCELLLSRKSYHYWNQIRRNFFKSWALLICWLNTVCQTSPFAPNNTESELTSYRKFARILDEILDDTMLDMLDGESTCKASKSISKIYGSNIPLNKGFGLRIDLILATKNIELSTSEWKWNKTPPAKCLQQQAKNIRMNKAILTSLLDLPFSEADGNRVFTVGMDWTGPMGYMFAIKQVKDVYVAKPISTLLMPTYLDELLSFEKTLDCLYAWRNHHLSLKEIMLPALCKYEQEKFFSSVLGTSEPADGNISPNIYFDTVSTSSQSGPCHD